MNGWERIGVVLAILFGVPAFLIAYSQNDSAYGSVYPANDVKTLKGQEFWNAIYSQAQADDPERYKGCISSTVEMRAPIGEYDQSYSISCDKTVKHAVRKSILWGLLPGFIFWIFGVTVAWIISGFKRQKT
jgi:hypothetical protein